MPRHPVPTHLHQLRVTPAQFHAKHFSAVGGTAQKVHSTVRENVLCGKNKAWAWDVGEREEGGVVEGMGEGVERAQQ